MTTTKDYIRKTAWFTSNGLPDPRMEGPERATNASVRLNVESYTEWFKKFLEVLKITKPKENFQ